MKTVVHAMFNALPLTLALTPYPYPYLYPNPYHNQLPPSASRSPVRRARALGGAASPARRLAHGLGCSRSVPALRSAGYHPHSAIPFPREVAALRVRVRVRLRARVRVGVRVLQSVPS